MRLVQLINHILHEEMKFLVGARRRDERRKAFMHLLPIDAAKRRIIKAVIDCFPDYLERVLPFLGIRFLARRRSDRPGIRSNLLAKGAGADAKGEYCAKQLRVCLIQL